MVIGAHQMVACCLGRGIRAVGCVGRRFGERRVVRPQRAVNLVSGYVQEAEGRLFGPWQ